MGVIFKLTDVFNEYWIEEVFFFVSLSVSAYSGCLWTEVVINHVMYWGVCCFANLVTVKRCKKIRPSSLARPSLWSPSLRSPFSRSPSLRVPEDVINTRCTESRIDWPYQSLLTSPGVIQFFSSDQFSIWVACDCYCQLCVLACVVCVVCWHVYFSAVCRLLACVVCIDWFFLFLLLAFWYVYSKTTATLYDSLS